MLTFFIVSLSIIVFSQDPYIMDGAGEGLGQYGYLELDASTFVKLNRSNHGNVRHLGARWYVTNGSGEEVVYWTTPNDNNWQCDGDNTSNNNTDNYNPNDFNGEFVAGSNCYVSVYAEYCDGAKNPNGGTGTGYNERHFQVLNLENDAFADVVDNVLYDAQGDCNHDNLVGSFTIDPGALNGISLTRFWFKNIGTTLEGTDIPNDAFKVYYEPVTGSETFDKTEDSFMVYGDYNSNSTSNNEYGNDAVSASINGKTRFYVTMCKVNLPSANAKTVQLIILNDGITFDPLLDNHGLFRVGETDISGKSITVPITLIDFKAELDEVRENVNLFWSTESEINNSHFNILKSKDALNWDLVGEVEANGDSKQLNEYEFVDSAPYIGLNYYKLEQVDFDGESTFYGPVLVNVESNLSIDVFPNPVDDNLIIYTKHVDVNIEIINSLGEIIRSEKLINNNLDVVNLKSGLYRILFKDDSNKLIAVKTIIKK